MAPLMKSLIVATSTMVIAVLLGCTGSICDFPVEPEGQDRICHDIVFHQNVSDRRYCTADLGSFCEMGSDGQQYRTDHGTPDWTVTLHGMDPGIHLLGNSYGSGGSGEDRRGQQNAGITPCDFPGSGTGYCGIGHVCMAEFLE